MKTFNQFLSEAAISDKNKLAHAHKALQDSIKDYKETETKPKDHKDLARYAKELSHDINNHGFSAFEHIDKLAPEYHKKHFEKK